MRLRMIPNGQSPSTISGDQVLPMMFNLGIKIVCQCKTECCRINPSCAQGQWSSLHSWEWKIITTRNRLALTRHAHNQKWSYIHHSVSHLTLFWCLDIENHSRNLIWNLTVPPSQEWEGSITSVPHSPPLGPGLGGTGCCKYCPTLSSHLEIFFVNWY